jgi:predicted hotdog family 3-hydroxylacyl-ACP dehydratase
MEGFRKIGCHDAQAEGFLLGIKKLGIFGSARVGDTLRITVHKAVKYGDFGIVRGEVYKGNELLARGEVKVWQNDSNAAA